MRYIGGKSRIAKEIVSFFSDSELYIEPFVGGAAVYQQAHRKFDKTVVSDSCLDLCLMWKALRDGWEPPNECDEEEYAKQKNAEPSAWRGLVGFGQSYGGKWFGGYARGCTNWGEPRNYLDESIRNCKKIAPYMQEIMCADYRAIDPPASSVVYCDPPYAATQGFDATGTFRTDEFWEIMRKWRAKTDGLFISEYDAPSDFTCIASFGTRQQLALPEQGRDLRIEKLWV